MTGDSQTLQEAFQRLRPGARVHGIAAVLLPYTQAGTVDWPGFERHVAYTRDAGLDVAVNMDTGFGDLLSPAERESVLNVTRGVLGPDGPFYAGAYASPGADSAEGYAAALATIESYGATPVLVQCAAMHGMDAAAKAAFYRSIVARAPRGALAFELSPRFAPHGEIWQDECFERLLEIPGLLGAKHSSLDRSTELRRLAMRDRVRGSFRVYTGNDLAIDMVAYGSDYLLGLATFAPAAFAARDDALARGDAAFLPLNDALQHLGNVGFRAPIPAYKHAAALFLQLTGRLEGHAIHPDAPRRPAADRVLLLDCAVRMGLVDDVDRAWKEWVAPHLTG